MITRPVDRYEWERIVRRCRLGQTTSSVAMHVAQFGDTDGSNVRPSVARLARVTELSERTVRNGLTQLREIGLLERVRRGGRRGDAAWVDVYRLAIPGDVFDRVPHLDPDETGLCNHSPGWCAQPVDDRVEPGAPETPGGIPNRQLTTPQPAADDAQPAAHDFPTGRSCLLPNQDLPTDLTTDQSALDPAQPPTAREDCGSTGQVISMVGRVRR